MDIISALEHLNARIIRLENSKGKIGSFIGAPLGAASVTTTEFAYEIFHHATQWYDDIDSDDMTDLVTCMLQHDVPSTDQVTILTNIIRSRKDDFGAKMLFVQVYNIVINSGHHYRADMLHGIKLAVRAAYNITPTRV
jgi:hypothetical protein